MSDKVEVTRNTLLEAKQALYDGLIESGLNALQASNICKLKKHLYLEKI
jgi:hypothetical protein